MRKLILGVSIAAWLLFASVEYQPIQFLRLLASVEYNSDRFSDTLGVRNANEFVIAHLKATFPVHENFSVEFGVNNVTDENYAYQEGFPEQGRNYFANLNLRY